MSAEQRELVWIIAALRADIEAAIAEGLDIQPTINHTPTPIINVPAMRLSRRILPRSKSK